MHEVNKRYQSVKVSYLLMLKWFIFGAISVEISFCIINFMKVLNNNLIQLKYEWTFWLLVALYSFLLIAFSKGMGKKAASILRSKRIDLLIVTLSGSSSMFLIGGVGIEFIEEWLHSVPWLYLTLVSTLPIVFYLSRVIRVLQVNKESSKNRSKSLF